MIKQLAPILAALFLASCASTSFYDSRALLVSPWTKGERWKGSVSFGIPGAYEVTTIENYSTTPVNSKSRIENSAVFGSLYPTFGFDLSLMNRFDFVHSGSTGTGFKFQFLGDSTSKEVAGSVLVAGSSTQGSSRVNEVMTYQTKVDRTLLAVSIGKYLTEGVRGYATIANRYLKGSTMIYATTPNQVYDDTGYMTQASLGLETVFTSSSFIFEYTAGNADWSRGSQTPVAGFGLSWAYNW